jgi:hypothetical protein
MMVVQRARIYRRHSNQHHAALLAGPGTMAAWTKAGYLASATARSVDRLARNRWMQLEWRSWHNHAHVPAKG